MIKHRLEPKLRSAGERQLLVDLVDDALVVGCDRQEVQRAEA